MFDRKEDGDLLWDVFRMFEESAECGEGLRLGLGARLINHNPPGSVRIGRDCTIRGAIRCEKDGAVEIGDTVYVGDGVTLSTQVAVAIGDLTLLAHGVHIFDNDTHPSDPADREAHFKSILGLSEERAHQIGVGPVMIGRSCWVGFNAAIMKGVTIGDESIVAAHSVVLRDIPPCSLAAGNPARVVKALEVRPKV
jgi:acetyltransferase-like isoleucine patch superfamily enzyme